MTITTDRLDGDTLQHPPLRVFRVFGESVATLGRAFLPLVVGGILLTALRVAASFGLTRLFLARGLNPTLQTLVARGQIPAPGDVAATLTSASLFIVCTAIIHLLLLSTALRTSAGERLRGGDVVRRVPRLILPVLGAYIAVFVLSILGFVALIVPGLWVIGVYGVMTAVIVAEDRRRGFMGRTRQLTKRYRWPLVGLFMLLYITAFVLGLVGLGVGRLLPALGGPGAPLRIILALATSSILDGINAALAAAITAVAYWRLRAIKEGSSALTAVFE